VWIYGGGYSLGSATLDLYNPEQYVERDLVFVAMQYRLGSHGFLYFGKGSEAPGNVGLLDQVGNTATIENQFQLSSNT
jgi:carboxylesterase type B